MTVGDSSWPVRLYVYDLSQGMARQLSLPLTGRQIDGIWHTSIVCWDREYFFGQGISIVSPGTSHHGAPLETYELGETSIDRDTFDQLLLEDLRPRFRPQDYNLLSWNCNNFTQEVAQILTGADIPDHIRSLPADFLSTPFGQMMKPRIDAMFRGPGAAEIGPSSSQTPSATASGLLNQVASRAYTGNGPMQQPMPSGASAASSDPVRHIHSQANLQRLLGSFPCVAVLFTSETCPPCRIIKPEFARLAEQHHVAEHKPGPHKRIAFAQVDAGSAGTQALMQSCGITATPTVSCYVNGKLGTQVKGADVGELRSAVDLTLFEVYPFHPHTQVKRALKSFRCIPTRPHAFRAVPNLTAALQKLDAVIAEYKAKSFTEKADLQDARKSLTSTVIPFLQSHFDAVAKSQPAPRYGAEHFDGLRRAARPILACLPAEQVFPLVDVVRLALLIDPFAAALLSDVHKQTDHVGPLLATLTTVQKLASGSSWDAKQRPVFLTTARLLGNLTANEGFMDAVEHHEPLRSTVLDLVTTLLLCPDAGVRSSAATSAFNVALHEHKLRPEWLSNDASAPPTLGSRMGEGWETEMVSALIQAVQNETESDETLHRLSAATLLTVHLSPFWSEHLKPLLEVLEAQSAFEEKAKAASVVTQSKKRDELEGLLLDLAALCGSQ